MVQQNIEDLWKLMTIICSLFTNYSISGKYMQSTLTLLLVHKSKRDFRHLKTTPLTTATLQMKNIPIFLEPEEKENEVLC